MNLSLHLRKIPENRRLPDIPDHLSATYGKEGVDFHLFGQEPSPVDRIYVGDEFCLLRLPSAKELTRFCRFSIEKNVGLTLLLPVLTDAGLDRSAALFECLAKRYPEAEIVVNDIGTILFLRNHHPGFRVSMGRLFNKGFKDPRLSVKDRVLTTEVERLLSESTFDQPGFGELMARLKVKGLERDLLPHGDGIPGKLETYSTAYYFPFGYVTTGRVCRTAAFARKAGCDLTLGQHCAKPCNGLSFWMQNDAVPLKLIQEGNTVFYLYPFNRLMGLVEKAAEENHRLVYQGMAI